MYCICTILYTDRSEIDSTELMTGKLTKRENESDRVKQGGRNTVDLKSGLMCTVHVPK
jgi:hypothetical protein